VPLLVEALLGGIGPDLTPVLLGKAGTGEEVGPRLGEQRGGLGKALLLALESDSRTYGTARSTRGSSCGLLIRAGSISKPRAWASSRNAWSSRGVRGAASITITFSESGMITANTPPKKRHALLEPLDDLGQRLPEAQPAELVPARAGGEHQAPAQASATLRPVPQQARPPEVTCRSTPGSPSATGTVLRCPPNSSSAAQNRCSVRYGTTTPRRASRECTSVSRRPASSFSVRNPRSPSSRYQASPYRCHGRPRLQPLGHHPQQLIAQRLVTAPRSRPARWTAAT